MVEFNVFSNFFNNWIFLSVLSVTVVVQIVLVQYGGFAVKCAPLTLSQHLLCVGIGMLCLPFGVLFRCVPVSFFDWSKKADDDAHSKKLRSNTGSDLEALRKSTRATELPGPEESPLLGRKLS